MAGTSTWMIVGLFIDGWAHDNDKPEDFFTPWHGLLYSGFLACALCFTVIARRRVDGARSLRRALPPGYGLGAVGVIGFGLGGVADLAWHSVFGVEVDSVALVSPPHLLLFASGVLIASTPARAAWHDTAVGPAVPHSAFLPALVATTVSTATVAFFFMNHTVFSYELLANDRQAWGSASAEDRDWFFNLDFSDFVIQTVLLCGPVLLLLRRWRPPFGTVTVVWTATAVLVGGIRGFEVPWTFAAALLGGLCVDAAIARLGAGPGAERATRAVASLMPVALWGWWFLTAAIVTDVVWEAGAWTGTIVMCSLTSLGLSLLGTSPVGAREAPAVEVEARHRGEAGLPAP